MLADKYPLYLANQPQQPNADLEVIDKYSGDTATRVALADKQIIDNAIGAAVEAARPMRELPSYKRREVLEHCVRKFKERFDDLAHSLCIEAGKPIADARGEVTRLLDTFRIAAGEAERITGEVMPMDIAQRTARYRGMWKRVPVGPCSFISPFNFPLNLAAHKIAPAIAAGCPFVLKPATKTPIGALIIGEALAETDLPKGAFSILPASRDAAEPLTTDERLKLLSFTGSAEVGWKLKSKAGKKRVVLELGGNAACIVDEGVDLEDCVARLVHGAFYQSGQSCISVQRILIHESLYEELKSKLIDAVTALKAGDPKDEETKIGPIISEDDATQIEEWVNKAVEKGAKVLCGGKREKAMMQATLLENVPRDVNAYCEEIFGPVALLSRFSNFDAAINEANDSRYGLQAGVFTPYYQRAMQAWDELEVGGVIINDVPSWRVDHMPYGGVKDSGLYREGLRFSIEDMTEIRLLASRDV